MISNDLLDAYIFPYPEQCSEVCIYYLIRTFNTFNALKSIETIQR